MKTLYKFTENGGTTHGGYKWPLPKKVGGKWVPGAWTVPIEGKLVACANGYHLTDFKHWRNWRNEEMYEVECKGRGVNNGAKYVVRQARLTRRVEKWNDQTLRLFAVWCARNALALVKNPDPRSVNAVDVAEKFANGKSTKKELAAAWDAAWAAAGAAAWDAAWAAAGAAAWDAAWAAAWAAAGAAAWDAAWAAAGAAAGAAAWDAAWAAAWAAQDRHLFEILGLKK
jgi:hypothetical protein